MTAVKSLYLLWGMVDTSSYSGDFLVTAISLNSSNCVFTTFSLYRFQLDFVLYTTCGDLLTAGENV